MAAEPRKPETPRRRKWLVYLAELAIGTVLSVGVILLLVQGLDRLFPDATDLGQLVRRSDINRDATRLHLDSDARPTVVARLSNLRNDVRQKPATSITWSAARKGQQLWDRHAIQSYDNSQATIHFDDSNRLDLGESSLVVVRRPRRKRGLRRAAVLFMDGFLKLRLRAAGATAAGTEGLQLDVVAGKGTVRADPTAGETAEIGLATRGTESSVAVYDGAVEIEWEDRISTVPEGYSVTFDEVNAPGAPQPLPGVPKPVAPADAEAFSYRSTPPRVSFRWSDVGADKTRLEIAKDAEFTRVVYKGELEEPEFVHGNLEAGRYYWRVQALRGQIEGLPSRTRTLEIRQDEKAPLLEIAFPAGVVRDDRITLRGKTDPGGRIVIGDASETAGLDGFFEHIMKLDDGYNFVVVQAIDANGNTTFRSHTFNVQLPQTERSP